MSGLKLQRPRGPRSPYYVVRGTYLGVSLRNGRSTGTADRTVAKKILQKWKREIESGAYSDPAKPTFADAVTSYGNAGGDERFTLKLFDRFGKMRLDQITQAMVDAAAVELYPDGTPATRNRQVYTPMSAILHHAGVDIEFKRPKGAKGNPRQTYLKPDEAFALLDAADAIGVRFGAMCSFFLYTGSRLSEGLRLEWDDVDLTACTALVRETKNGSPRVVYLPEVVVAALASIPIEERGRTVFGYSKNNGTRPGGIYHMYHQAKAAAGLVFKEQVAFHAFRHTYGAWMERYGDADLVATGAWKSREASDGYAHVEASEEARKADRMPVRRARCPTYDGLYSGKWKHPKVSGHG